MGIQTSLLTGDWEEITGDGGVLVLESGVSSRRGGEVCGQGSESAVLLGWRRCRKSLKFG